MNQISGRIFYDYCTAVHAFKQEESRTCLYILEIFSVAFWV